MDRNDTILFIKRGKNNSVVLHLRGTNATLSLFNLAYSFPYIRDLRNNIAHHILSFAFPPCPLQRRHNLTPYILLWPFSALWNENLYWKDKNLRDVQKITWILERRSKDYLRDVHETYWCEYDEFSWYASKLCMFQWYIIVHYLLFIFIVFHDSTFYHH